MSSVPPNCSFELDDVEKDWTWSKPFDFIFSRVMAGSLTDYQAYVDKAFQYVSSSDRPSAEHPLEIPIAVIAIPRTPRPVPLIFLF